MAKYYTGTINDLLDVIIQLQHADHDYESGNYITAHIGFLQAKEAAGLERAMGAAGFGRGEFSRDLYNKFIKFISVQDVHLNTYLKFTGEAEKEFFKEKLEDPSFKQVENLRQIALVSPESGTLADVTAAQCIPQYLGNGRAFAVDLVAAVAMHHGKQVVRPLRQCARSLVTMGHER